MSVALTNEERFIANCLLEGEVGVRQKLNAGRYSERKTGWANSWLERVEGGKSDATKAQERSLGVLNARKPDRHFAAAISLLLLLLLGAAALWGFG